MPAPSQLSIAISSVSRLLKEHSTYRSELASQEQRLQRSRETGQTGDDDENCAYLITQEEKAVEETKAVFKPLREKIADAVQKLEALLSQPKAGELDPAEVAKAKEVIAEAQKSG